jgi:hypothetical protein
MAYNVDGATAYFAEGGLGEVIGFTDIARQMQQPKVQMDTDMAMALLILADEALKARKATRQ